jgi:hypothetical protein
LTQTAGDPYADRIAKPGGGVCRAFKDRITEIDEKLGCVEKLSVLQPFDT